MVSNKMLEKLVRLLEDELDDMKEQNDELFTSRQEGTEMLVTCAKKLHSLNKTGFDEWMASYPHINKYMFDFDKDK